MTLAYIICVRYDVCPIKRGTVALVIDDRPRREGDMNARPFAAKIKQTCPAVR